jgi:thiopurine S-methyltransferase
MGSFLHYATLTLLSLVLIHTNRSMSLASAALITKPTEPKMKPKDEDSEILIRWAQRWSISKTGWQKSDPHHFLIKHGNDIIPGLIPSSGSDAGSCDSEILDGDDHGAKRVFFPLCGKTVDMKFLAENKAIKEVVGVDGIKKALEEFAEENPSLNIKEVDQIGSSFGKFVGNNVSLLKGNFFDIDEEVTGGQFDVIVDRASIVAIDPSLRDDYVSILGKLIKPGGSILLITIDRRAGTDEARSAGPPFSIDDTEIQRLYGSLDWVESLTKMSEHNEFETEEDKKRWTMQGVDSLFELCYVIKAKKLRSSM